MLQIYISVDYFVGGISVSDSETDGDNIIVNENKVVDDIVQNLGDEALDGLYYSKSDDDNIDITGEDVDDEDKEKMKRPIRNKWEKSQELKWEHLTKKLLAILGCSYSVHIQFFILSENDNFLIQPRRISKKSR